MPTPSQDSLSEPERKLIDVIRDTRANPEDKLHAILLERPEEFMQYLINDSHGAVKLRLYVVAAELGVGMKTLQRNFAKKYKKAMVDFHLEARLDFAKFLLRVMRGEKMSVIAKHIGYDREPEFTRFFEKLMHEPPAKWAEREHRRADRKAAQLRADEENHPPSSL